MVLHPVAEARPALSAACQPAWNVIAETQSRVAESYWLITQPEHAQLAGLLAANISSERVPLLDEPLVRAISMHDAGWALFPFERDPPAPPPTAASGKPLSFLEIPPEEFIRAWTQSIDHGEAISPAGGIVVSRHFCRLARHRLTTGGDNARDTMRVNDFVDNEQRREARLRRGTPYSSRELEYLTDILQFCDVLSLYLCCGGRDTVEFPQSVAGERPRLHYAGGTYSLEPSPFQPKQGRSGSQTERRLRLQVRAWPFPPAGAAVSNATLEFQLR